MPICRVCANSNLSCCNIFFASAICTHSLDTCNSQSNGVLGSHPSTICQICHLLGHSTGAFPERYRSQPQSLSPAFASFAAGETGDDIWYPDSTAGSYMTPSKGIMSSKSPYSGPTKIRVGNGTSIPIKNIGTMHIPINSGPLFLKYVCHVPMLKHNLLSINQLCRDNQYFVIFDSNCFFLRRIITRGRSSSGDLVGVMLTPCIFHVRCYL